MIFPLCRSAVVIQNCKFDPEWTSHLERKTETTELCLRFAPCLSQVMSCSGSGSGTKSRLTWPHRHRLGNGVNSILYLHPSITPDFIFWKCWISKHWYWWPWTLHWNTVRLVINHKQSSVTNISILFVLFNPIDTWQRYFALLHCIALLCDYWQYCKRPEQKQSRPILWCTALKMAQSRQWPGESD